MPPVNTIVSTQFILPAYLSQNGQVTDNTWNNTANLFLVDGDVANSNVNGGVASDVTLGGYNFLYNGVSIPQNAIVTGIEMKIVGYRGAQTVPAIDLEVSFYDNSNGNDNFYPYTTPVTTLTQAMSEIVIGGSNYLFASSFTMEQISNMKMNLMANGDIYIDSFLVKLYFYIPSSGADPVVTTGICIDCDSPIQVQDMYLELPFLIGETKFYLKKGSFAYPNGTPVQVGDVGTCGGKIPFVFDEGKKKANGNFEENATLDTSTGSWQVLPSGVIEMDLFAVTQRGLDFKTPGTHVASLMSNHDANSKVIISNNTPYNLTLIRTCQANTVFSPPIDVKEEGAIVVDPIHSINFKGNGVQVTQNATDPFQADVLITGDGTSTPVPDSVTSATSGDTQVPSLTWVHTCLGSDRLLTVQVSMEEGKTITSLTYNGVALTFRVANEINGTRMEIWTLTAPSVGTHNIIVTFSANSYISGGAESWTGVDQITPVGTLGSSIGTSLIPTLVINTLFDNSVIVDGLSTDLTPILLIQGANQVLNWSIFSNEDTRQGASSYEIAGTSPDAVTIDYAITQNTDWTLCAIEIKGITSATQALVVEDEGITIDSNVVKINFVGPGVIVTQTSPNEVEVEIPGGGGDEFVGATATDTTPNFLDSKLEIVSADSSVAIAKTIQNPGANEKISYDLSVPGGSGGGTKLAIDTTEVTVTGTVAETVLFSVPIPAGTLGINNGIRFSVMLLDTVVTAIASLRVKYGGTTISTTVLAIAGGSNQILSGIILADGATNAQKGQTLFEREDAQSTFPSPVTVSAVDSTILQDLEITIELGDVGDSYTAEAIVVEKISSLNDGIIIQMTASEDLTIGEVVGVSNIVPNAVARNNAPYYSHVLTGITNQYSTSIFVILPIADNKVIMLSQEDITGDLYVVVATANRSNLDTLYTYGTPVLITNDHTLDSQSNYGIHILDVDKFCVSYKTATNTDQIQLVAGTVSGLVIALGSPATVATMTAGTVIAFDMTQLDIDKGVMTWVNNTGTDLGTVVYTFTGTVATIGAVVQRDVAIEELGFGIGKVATDKFCVATKTNTNLSGQIATVSGTVITFGVLFTTSSGISNSSLTTIILNPTDNVMVIIFANGTGSLSNAMCATIAGTTPTFGNELTSISQTSRSATVLSATEVLFHDSSGGSGLLKLIKITGVTLTIDTVMTGVSDLSLDNRTSRYLITDNTGYFNLTMLEGTNERHCIEGMSDNQIGIVQDTQTIGGTVQVLINGVDSNQTGLNTGSTLEGYIIKNSTSVLVK